MKYAISIYIVLFFSIQAVAQNAEQAIKIPNPEYINHIYYYNASENTLVNLEKTEAGMKTKMKAMGFGGASAAYTIEGAKSTVRIKTGDSIYFVIKTGNTMMDPSMTLQLYKFESKKDSRDAMMSTQGGMMNKKKNNAGTAGVQFNLKKSGNDVYIIIPGSTFTPGEYGFLNTMMMNHTGGSYPTYVVFAFAVE